MLGLDHFLTFIQSPLGTLNIVIHRCAYVYDVYLLFVYNKQIN